MSRKISRDSLDAHRKKTVDQENVDSVNKGMEYYQNGQYLLSIEKMKDVLRQNKNNEVAKRYIEMAQRAEQEINDDIDSGIEYYKKGQYQLAIEKMKGVLRLDRNNQTARDYVEKAKRRQRKADSAFVHMEIGPSR